MRKLVLIISAFCFSNALHAQTRLVEKVTQKGDELIIPYEKHILSNGLTLIIHEDHSDPVVHVDVTYHVGSAREEIGKSGFAHFFEHMMFQGSDNVGDEQHFKIVTEAGGTLNGTTNTDRTNYFETVPNNQLEKMLWLEADRMGFLLDAVTQRKFEIQRETVKNERGQNYDNRPYGLVNEVINKNLYPYGHPYSWLTIGYVEDLNRVNVEDLKNFFLRWYGPNNATLTVGGDVKPAEVVKLVEKYFGSIPKGPDVQNMSLPAPVLNSDRYVTLVDNYARIPQLIFTYPTIPSFHEDQYALSCLAEILGQGKNSIFYQEIIKGQNALAASAFSSNSELSGTFRLSLTPNPNGSLEAGKKLIEDALKAFEARGVTDEDIEKFKGSFESQYVNRLQSVSGKVSQLAYFETFTGNPNQIGSELEKNLKVTKQDVLRVYEKYIKGKHAVILSVVPKGQESNIAGAENYTVDESNYTAPDYGYNGLTYQKPRDNFDRSKIPGNGPNPVVQIPDFWKKTLPGDIKAIGIETDELPVVTLTLTIPGGHLAMANDTSKIGLPRIFAALMNEDTKNFTAEQMQVELQKIGSQISVFNGFDGITYRIQTLKKNLDRTLVLLEERIFNPKFTQEAFDRIQKQAIEGFKQSKSQPAFIASDVFAKINYGNSILGLSESGTERTISNIRLEDVENYYANYLTSKNAKLVVVGDVEEKEILSKLNFLSKLPNKEIKLPTVPAVAPAATTKIYLVDVPRAAQTEFRVGNVTGLKYDATGDYYMATLTNFALGGAFNSRINLNLREDKGWTYGARTGFSGDKYTGSFAFSSGIRANATDSALVEVIKELKEFTTGGITADEIQFMKSALGQRDALLYETGFQKANFVGRILEYDLPSNFVDRQSKILQNLTKAQVDQSSRKWINTDKMNILLVGDKQAILPGLQKFGYEIIELDLDGNPIVGK
jgi:zinc protease